MSFSLSNFEELDGTCQNHDQWMHVLYRKSATVSQLGGWMVVDEGTKSFPSRKLVHAARYGTLKTNQTRLGMTPKHFHTIPTSSAILLSLTQICFVFVSCVQRRVVEGSVVGSGGCVVYGE